MQWLLMLLLILLTFGHLTRVELASGLAVYPQDVIAGIMLVLVTLEALRKRALPKAKLLKPIGIFTAAAVLSLFLAIPNYGLAETLVGSLYLVRWVAYAGIYLFSREFLFKRKLKVGKRIITLKEALLISGLALATIGIIQYVVFPDLRELKLLGWDDHYYRLAGTILDPGFTGILLVLTGLLALEVRLGTKEKIAAVGLPLIALLFTYSRASYLAFAVGLLIYLLRKGNLKRWILVIAIFVLTLPLLPRPGGEGVNLLRLYSITSRVETWRNAVAIAKDHPFFGVGFNLLRFANREYGFFPLDWQTSHSAAGVENSYLFVLATTGVVGLVAYTNLLYSFFKRMWSRSVAGLAGLSAVAVHSLFTNTWFYPWVMIWVWIWLAAVESEASSRGGNPDKRSAVGTKARR